MGRSLADVFVTVAPDMSKFGPQLKRELHKTNVDAEGKRLGNKLGERVGSGVKSHLAGALTGLGGAFAALGVISVFKGFIDGAQESARIGRVTTAVIKSTGGAAKVTATQVGNLAQAISNKTGADDEAIQSGQNLLLTFTNIKNGVGAGNKIFDRASAAIVDMTASLHNGAVTSEGLKGSSIQLGKALNDPIKGISALSKVGVSFTDQQKKQIKEMVKSGNVMGAQKVILNELGKEFGGTAAAAADPMTRLTTIVDNLGEQLGGYLLPYVAKFADWLGKKAVPAVSSFFTGLQNDGSLSTFQHDLSNIIHISTQVVGWLTRNKDVVVALGAAFAVVKIGQFTSGLFTAIKATRAMIIAQGGLNAVLVANPIGLVIVAIAALVAGFVLAYSRSETFRKVVNATLHGVTVGFQHLWGVLKPIFRFIASTWLNVASVIVNGAAKALGWVPGVGPKLRKAADAFNRFKDQANRALDGIKDEGVTVSARFHNGLPRTLYGVRVGGGAGSSRGGITASMADGGRVNGGIRGVDSVPILAMPGEHMLRTSEVEAAGGHGAIERFRAGLRSGAVRLARGGPVDPDRMNMALGRGANELGQVAARAIAKTLNSFGFNPGLVGGLNFAKAQSGKPYIWGSAGPRGYDCSGFMSAILNVVQGRNPYTRRGSTDTFPWAGFAPGPGAFMIGSRRGNPGHMAGTINGVNVESSGSIGAHYGRSARGARDSLFTMLYHLKGYAKGGPIGDGPFDILNPRGDEYAGAAIRKAILGKATLLDSGGWISPGLNLIANGTGKPERVPDPSGPTRLHPDDIRALASGIGDAVLAGIGSNNRYVARSADRIVRGG